MAFQLPAPIDSTQLLEEAIRRRLALLAQPTPMQTLAPTIIQAAGNVGQGIAKGVDNYQDRKQQLARLSSEQDYQRQSLDLRRQEEERQRVQGERELSIKEKSMGGIKPPPGFRWTTDGGLEPIPGGPASIKIGKEEDKAANLQSGAVSQADRIIGKVDQALNKIGSTTTGYGGALMRAIPGTSARDLSSDLQTIKANLGFAELQEMRRNSPTGGALGQVAVQELEALQATIASLDQAQSGEQLKDRLNEVKKHYEKWKWAVLMSAQGKQQPAPRNSDPLGLGI